MTRLVPLAVALSVLAAPALAQEAPPAEGPLTTAPPPVADTAPEGPADPGPAVRRAAETLNATIAALQAGTLDPAALSPTLAETVAGQSAAITPTLKALGAVTQIEHRGQVQGAERFRVSFESGATDWFIALDEAGIVTALVFREAD